MKLLTVPQVAEATQLCEDTIYRKLKAGKLKGSKLDGVWRISESDLEAWLDASRPVLAQPSNGDRLALPWANGGGER